MTRKTLILAAAGGSAALLLGAFYFQFAEGLRPCKLCLWQRWPHGGAVFLGLIALIRPRREILALAGLVVLAGAAIGFYHAGIEQAWWAGPDTCTAGSIEGMTTKDLLEQIMAAPVVRCDEIAWDFAGLSMAAWNALLSLGLALIWLRAAYASSSASQ